jgi:hypothetical protein
MTSRIPAAIDGLLAALRALQATTLAGVDIYDGPKLDASQNGQRLFIGFDDQTVGATGAQDWASMPASGRSVAENITVNCVAESSTGQTDAKGRRDQCFSIIAAVEGVIKADPTLGGAINGYAKPPDNITVQQAQTAQGAVCTVFFGISYYARF